MSRSEGIIDRARVEGKRVAIVGVGGLGCTAASLLARQGMDLVLIDGDVVEKSNLERQVLFKEKDINRPKVDVAKEQLESFTNIRKIFDTLTDDNTKMLEGVDFVLDCTDNVDTRLVINEFCIENNIPWVYSAAVKEIGALYLIDPEDEGRACYECLNGDKSGESACDVGVMNTTVSIVATISAKMIVDFFAKDTYEKDLLRIDCETMSIERIRVKRKETCKCRRRR